jgi:DNA uptake protein ComE-like DNA-binding protein
MRATALLTAVTLAAGCGAHRTELAATCALAGVTAVAAGFAIAREDEDGNGPVPGIMIGVGAGFLGGALAALLVPRSESAPGPSPVDVAGALVLANSPKETADTLAQGAGIERQIALRIVTHRETDRFDTLAELRAVSGVDDQVLDHLIQRGRSLGYAR